MNYLYVISENGLLDSSPCKLGISEEPGTRLKSIDQRYDYVQNPEIVSLFVTDGKTQDIEQRAIQHFSDYSLGSTREWFGLPASQIADWLAGIEECESIEWTALVGEEKDARPSAPADENKNKPGYYVRESIDQELGKLRHEIAYKLGIDKISKSELTEAAIDLALRDWKDERKKSRIAEWVRIRYDQKN